MVALYWKLWSGLWLPLLHLSPTCLPSFVVSSLGLCGRVFNCIPFICFPCLLSFVSQLGCLSFKCLPYLPSAPVVGSSAAGSSFASSFISRVSVQLSPVSRCLWSALRLPCLPSFVFSLGPSRVSKSPLLSPMSPFRWLWLGFPLLRLATSCSLFPQTVCC